MTFEPHRAIVSTGDSGIGRAVAVALAGAGMDVALTGLELVGDDERCVVLRGLLQLRLLAERAGADLRDHRGDAPARV